MKILYIHKLKVNAIEWARVSEHNLELWRFSMWPACMLERSRGMGNRDCICINVLIVFMWTKSPLWKWIPWLFSQPVLWFDLWWARLRKADLLLHETKLEAAVLLVWGCGSRVKLFQNQTPEMCTVLVLELQTPLTAYPLRCYILLLADVDMDTANLVKIQWEFKACQHWKKAVAILKDAIREKKQVNYIISERCVQGAFRKIRVQWLCNKIRICFGRCFPQWSLGARRQCNKLIRPKKE